MVIKMEGEGGRIVCAVIGNFVTYKAGSA